MTTLILFRKVIQLDSKRNLYKWKNFSKYCKRRKYCVRELDDLCWLCKEQYTEQRSVSSRLVNFFRTFWIRAERKDVYNAVCCIALTLFCLQWPVLSQKLDYQQLNHLFFSLPVEYDSNNQSCQTCPEVDSIIYTPTAPSKAAGNIPRAGAYGWIYFDFLLAVSPGYIVDHFKNVAHLSVNTEEWRPTLTLTPIEMIKLCCNIFQCILWQD